MFKKIAIITLSTMALIAVLVPTFVFAATVPAGNSATSIATTLTDPYMNIQGILDSYSDSNPNTSYACRLTNYKNGQIILGAGDVLAIGYSHGGYNNGFVDSLRVGLSGEFVNYGTIILYPGSKIIIDKEAVFRSAGRIINQGGTIEFIDADQSIEYFTLPTINKGNSKAEQNTIIIEDAGINAFISSSKPNAKKHLADNNELQAAIAGSPLLKIHPGYKQGQVFAGFEIVGNTIDANTLTSDETFYYLDIPTYTKGQTIIIKALWQEK